MLKKTMTGMLTATAVFAAASGVVAHGLPMPMTLTDDAMQNRLFLLDEQVLADGSRSVHRASSDDAVGVVCEWTAIVKFDPVTFEAMDAKINHDCEAGRPVDPEWVKGPTFEYEFVMDTNLTVRTEYKAAEQIVVEVSATSPDSTGYVSRYIREWNFAAGQVCIRSDDSQVDAAGNFKPYLEADMGCYSIPDNDYAARLRAGLAAVPAP